MDYRAVEQELWSRLIQLHHKIADDTFESRIWAYHVGMKDALFEFWEWFRANGEKNK